MSNPMQILGSTHYAAMLAYGDFLLAGGGSIHCDAIQGISGVVTSDAMQMLPDGRPLANLTRILTHFHWPDPGIVIEQNPSKPNTGTLTGNSPGGQAQLLPGTASFSQHIILTFNGRPLANREPLTMTAENVTAWPPVGSSFILIGQTDFYDLGEVDNPSAQVIASLCACKAVVVDEITLPTDSGA
ncbi:MAG TPA: hypothetical protein VHI13_20765 [Candidatus Kapabacteria bacterium]|nr:hypothetical protein [Candidatus Kapabacteria bacterium]